MHTHLEKISYLEKMLMAALPCHANGCPYLGMLMDAFTLLCQCALIRISLC